jgi:23S rRNA pseudouridine1911/1915/1917 synthase
VLRVRVDPGSADAGARLDQIVARLAGGVSVHAARRLIAEGRVRVDGRRAALGKKGARLAPGQTVEVDSDGGADTAAGPAAAGGPAATSPGAMADRLAPIPEPAAPLVVLYTDADLVAVDKPAGIASHPLRAGETGTLANALVARFPECALAGGDPREGGLGHRLDRETSGVLLAARSHGSWLALRAALKDPACEKSYLAEVIGRPEARGRLAAPIGRSGRRGRRVRVGDGRNPLPAVTEWEEIEARGASTLIRARLHSGRAHQVRAHLAATGHPIAGDAVYGGAEALEIARAFGVTSLRLFAESVRLRHPTSGDAFFIAAPAPEWGKMLAR